MGEEVKVIDLTPDCDAIVELIRHMHHTGYQVEAFKILSAGWPHMPIGKAVALLNSEIDLQGALSE